MKIVSQTIKTVSRGKGTLAPTKDIQFKKPKPKRKPKNCNCKFYLQTLKKIHLKFENKIINCKQCNKAVNDQSILGHFQSNKIECLVDCNEFTDVKIWFIKCNHLKMIMKNCKNHSKFVESMKRKVALQNILLNKISN